MKVNPYVPETNILRGSRFFELFTTINYVELDETFMNISMSKEINDKFDNFTHNILNTKNFSLNYLIIEYSTHFKFAQ